METEIFVLCDAAADYQGRLNILGVFDSIFSKTVPAVHPHCSVALRIRFSRTEVGEHSLFLHIVDYDGKMVIPPLDGKFIVEMQDHERYGAINLVLNLQGLTFNSFGEYAVNISVDRHQIASLPFHVRQAK